MFKLLQQGRIAIGSVVLIMCQYVNLSPPQGSHLVNFPLFRNVLSVFYTPKIDRLINLRIGWNHKGLKIRQQSLRGFLTTRMLPDTTDTKWRHRRIGPWIPSLLPINITARKPKPKEQTRNREFGRCRRGDDKRQSPRSSTMASVVKGKTLADTGTLSPKRYTTLRQRQCQLPSVYPHPIVCGVPMFRLKISRQVQSYRLLLRR